MTSVPQVTGPSVEPEPRRLSAPPEDLTVIDPERIGELIAEVGAAATAEMLTVYWRETERRLAVLRVLAVDQSDAICLEAHTIKGSSGIFGLPRVAAMAWALERSAATVTAQDYPVLLEQLDAAYAASKREFGAYLENILRDVASAAGSG
jgi:HPt (histidine-containing phosphotransfer) domain-containing protein